MNQSPLRLGVAGLGRAFTIMLPTFLQDRRVQLVAAADPSPAPRARFQSDFGGTVFADVEALCRDPGVEAVYLATPHQFHAEHVELAAAHGKHVLVEKPMAISVAECTRMVDAVNRSGVQMVVGPSHSFDTPILRTREIVASGRFGAVRMIHAMDFTDFLYRPRRPEELDTSRGGGVVHSQAAHQIDIVRLLGGGMVETVRAFTGSWDPARPTEGAYSALLSFAGGAFCSATYSGYGHYDSDLLMEGIGESGEKKPAGQYGAARRRLRAGGTPQEEAALKARRNFGGPDYLPPALAAQHAHQHFGHLVVCCEKADLRPTPFGIEIHEDEQQRFERLPAPAIPRTEVIDELVAAVRLGREPVHDAAWGRATTEVCLAILESARTGAECRMAYQVTVD